METAKRCGTPAPRSFDTWVGRIIPRIKEHGLDEWREALTKIEASPFLRGEKGWRIDIEFLLSPTGFDKVLSGEYDHRPSGTSLAKGNSDGPLPIEALRKLHRIYPLKSLSDWDRHYRDKYGPGPGESGSRVPPEFIREIGFPLSSTRGST